jgi:hypothetical protein
MVPTTPSPFHHSADPNRESDSGNSGNRENERRKGEQRLRGWAPRSRNPCSSPRPPLWHPRERSEKLSCAFHLSFLFRHFLSLSSWNRPGGWQREACNEPPPRGQRRGNGQNVHRHSLDRLYASMNKQKKNKKGNPTGCRLSFASGS